MDGVEKDLGDQKIKPEEGQDLVIGWLWRVNENVSRGRVNENVSRVMVRFFWLA